MLCSSSQTPLPAVARWISDRWILCCLAVLSLSIQYNHIYSLFDHELQTTQKPMFKQAISCYFASLDFKR
jgi:hypothetical protein